MIKKLKVPAIDLRRTLLRASPRELLAVIDRIGPDVVEQLLDLFLDIDGWDDRAAVPDRALRTLCALGATADVTEAWADLVLDLDLDVDDDDDVTQEEFDVSRLGVVLGKTADPATAGPVLLDILDECVGKTGVIEEGWSFLLEPLCRFTERGWRDERTWSWLERLRLEQPDLWCSYVDGYGDDRAVPLLHALLDECDDGDRVAIEALAALETCGALRPIDLQRRQRMDAARTASRS